MVLWENQKAPLELFPQGPSDSVVVMAKVRYWMWRSSRLRNQLWSHQVLKESSGPSSPALQVILWLQVYRLVFPIVFPPHFLHELFWKVHFTHPHRKHLFFVQGPALISSVTFPHGEAWVVLVSPVLADERRDLKTQNSKSFLVFSVELSNLSCFSLQEIDLLSVREADRAVLKTQTLKLGHKQMWVCVLTPSLTSLVALSKWLYLCFLINTRGEIVCAFVWFIQGFRETLQNRA